MILTNEMRHIKWQETCKCICRLDTIVCNSKILNGKLQIAREWQLYVHIYIFFFYILEVLLFDLSNFLIKYSTVIFRFVIKN